MLEEFGRWLFSAWTILGAIKLSPKLDRLENIVGDEGEVVPLGQRVKFHFWMGENYHRITESFESEVT
jgi:hypothetical protein